MSDQVIARDEKGNEFVKEVKIIPSPYSYSKGGKMVDFGYPVQYNLDDLMRDYPFKRNLCIDGGGRNHKGSPVWISKEDMNRILEKYREEQK